MAAGLDARQARVTFTQVAKLRAKSMSQSLRTVSANRAKRSVEPSMAMSALLTRMSIWPKSAPLRLPAQL